MGSLYRAATALALTTIAASHQPEPRQYDIEIKAEAGIVEGAFLDSGGPDANFTGTYTISDDGTQLTAALDYKARSFFNRIGQELAGRTRGTLTAAIAPAMDTERFRNGSLEQRIVLTETAPRSKVFANSFEENGTTYSITLNEETDSLSVSIKRSSTAYSMQGTLIQEE